MAADSPSCRLGIVEGLGAERSVRFNVTQTVAVEAGAHDIGLD